MSDILNPFLEIPPYSLPRGEKDALHADALGMLTRLHYDRCEAYKNIVSLFGFDPTVSHAVEEIPLLPVRLFKEFDLLSVDLSEIVKTLTSSGTSGQKVSKVFLDKETTRNQTRVLAYIIASFIGKSRLPLIILDTEMVKRDRSMFSARGAGIIGFSTFGKKICYALDDTMNFDVKKVATFIEEHRGERVLLFGYTYMVWQYTVMKLQEAGIRFDLDDGVLFHVGGWKKLQNLAVDFTTFSRRFCDTFGNVAVYNYYGMAEQLGSIYVECEHGRMHASNFSDVIIRRPSDFSVADPGERGLIQLVSVLPTSYPGHSILTEDEGEITGIDDCHCGRLGKTFKIHGRIKNAEIRGCSDTYGQ